MSKRLIFGDDGSDHADLAWRWITAHSWPGWSVDVVSVIAPDTADGDARPARVPPDQGFAEGVESQVVQGDPRVALLKASRDADLLVVGPRGRGLLKAMHLGSTSEWLIQAPPVPLVIARSDRPTTRVVVAADGSVHAQAAAAAAAGLPWSGQMDVLVVTVGDQQQGTAITDATANVMRDSVASIHARVLHPDSLPVFARARDVLLDVIAEWGADLVVLGSQGLTSWQPVAEAGLLRAGSTASGVTAHAPCSVLIARG
jgi:nucleotide-binding universal stress UspA family protein